MPPLSLGCKPMTYLLFFLALFWFQDDERTYDIAKEEVEIAVQQFVNPDSSIAMPPKAHWEAAMQAVDVVLDFEPSRLIEGRYLFFSGMNLLHEGDIETAISDFNRSIQMDPNEAALSRYGLALAYSFQRELGKAEREFQTASELWPYWARPYAALAALYIDDDRFSEAEAAIRRSMERTEFEAAKGRQYLLLAQILKSQGRPEAVEEPLRLAVAATPDDLLLYEYLGLFLFQQRDRDGALEAWQEALLLSPSYGPIRRHVALAEQGVQVKGSSPFQPGESVLRITDPFLVGGTRFRAYQLSGISDDRLRVRVESAEFTPTVFLVSADGRLVDVPDIRSSYFSEIDHTFFEGGSYYLIVTAARPGRVGRFRVRLVD